MSHKLQIFQEMCLYPLAVYILVSQVRLSGLHPF